MNATLVSAGATAPRPVRPGVHRFGGTPLRALVLLAQQYSLQNAPAPLLRAHRSHNDLCRRSAPPESQGISGCRPRTSEAFCFRFEARTRGAATRWAPAAPRLVAAS